MAKPTDFSADGEIYTLQTATQGDGVDIVLIGDGFTDEDIADGTYETTMRQAMENFFGTLKSECLYRAHDTTHPEVKERIAQYIPFSNFEGISLKNGLTPHESRSKAAQYRVMLRHLLFVSVQTGTVHFSLPLNAVPSTPAALLQVRFRFLHIPYQCKQR